MRWQACITAVLLSGCQAIQAFDESRTPDELTFVKMWNRYTHCRSSTEVNQMWQDAQQLNRTVRLLDHAAHAARLLPDTLEQTLADPPSRLAVDPKAMAAACTLLAGQAAQNQGHRQFAAEVFSFVASHFSQPRYAYYQQQARMALDQIDSSVTEQVAMTIDRQP